MYTTTMLSTKYRFHSRGGVNHTYRHGHTIRTPLLSLTHARNTRRKTRFAIVISKKVLKSAVGRNRIRRRLYEVIRLQLPQIKTPTDHILQVHTKDLATTDFTELQSLIKELLTKAQRG